MQNAKLRDNDNVPVNAILAAVACTSVNKGTRS